MDLFVCCVSYFLSPINGISVTLGRCLAANMIKPSLYMPEWSVDKFKTAEGLHGLPFSQHFVTYHDGGDDTFIFLHPFEHYLNTDGLFTMADSNLFLNP